MCEGEGQQISKAFHILEGGLTFARKYNIMLDMKKLNAREFQHGFGKVTELLKPGQAITITKRGEPHGIFVKSGQRRRKAPDFAGNLRALGYSARAGQKLINRICDDIIS